MRNSESAIAGRRKGAFKKGPDSRRNTNGQLCKEAADYSIAFKNGLAKEMPAQELARILAKYIRLGRPWAIQIAVNKIVENPEQKHNVTLPSRFEIVFNGNGNGAKPTDGADKHPA